MRTITPWNDNWYFNKTAEVPATLPEGWKKVVLPHTWNAEDGQDGGNDYWRGTAMYVKSFFAAELPENDRVILELNGAAMIAEVSVNGQKLIHHEGGYSTFRVDMTPVIQENNLVCISVDNRDNDHCYPQKADFTFYGGLYRGVNLMTVSDAHFELLRDGTPGIKVTPAVDLEKKYAAVQVETWVSEGEEVQIAIGDQMRSAPVRDGYACAVLVLENVHLWDGLNDPYLYTVSASLVSGGAVTDEISARFGCRTIDFDPDKGFLLNGREYPLRGVSRHQDRAGIGNALTAKENQEDMALILEIGANTVRLAHYQQSQEFYDLCDENGLIVWAEIPYITMHMPNGRQNTLDQMCELITQCYNHPSIVCWGLSNEITASGNVTEDLMENHRLLNELCHKMDHTRPTAMAHAFMLEIEHPLIQTADIGGYNLYFGWYLGDLEQNDTFLDEYHSKFPQRIMGFTEYGADANPQFQSASPERGDYTESYQCLYHEHILRCIEKRPWLWATYVWNMFDFAADGRDEGGKHGENQKGLVTMDRKLKKDAFYLYKAAWSRSPFVHICGRRYVDRAEEVTEIKVYSNLSAVDLYLDGKLLERKQGRIAFVFQVPICGEHIIEAKAGNDCDRMMIRKVEKENPSYCFIQKGDVINWFDKENFKEDCYSIQDTYGELLENPEAGRLVREIMARSRARRGDVAKSTEGNKNLQRMMSGMKMVSMLKQAGPAVNAEEIIAFNTALQKIKK